VADSRTRTLDKRPWYRRLVGFELRETEVLALVVIAGIISGITFLLSGIPTHGDTWPHIVRVQVTYEAFRQGHLPNWSFFFYNGYPLLRFYSPLFYYLGAIIAFLTGGDPFQATKVLLFLLHIGTGVAFYLFARNRLRSPAAAFIASFAYLFSFVHMFYIQWLSRYPIELCLVLMPLSLWLLDRLLARPGLGRAVMLGIVLALLPLAHVLHAVFFAPFVLLWFFAAPSAAVGDSSFVIRHSSFARRLVWFLGACLLALLLSAFFLVPFLVEGMRYRMPEPFVPLPTPSLLTMFGLSRVLNGYSGGYIGLSVLVLVVLGAIRLAREHRLLRHPGFWGFLIAVLFAFNSRLPLLGRLPLVSNLTPDRFLFFALLFAALLAGYGYQALAGKPAQDSKVKGHKSKLFGFVSCVLSFDFTAPRWLWLPVLAVLFLDLGPRLITNVYQPVDVFLGSREYIYGKLAGRTDGRLLDVTPEGWWRYGRFPASGYLFARTPAVLGPPYHQFAPRSMLYAYAWVEDLAREFLDSTDQDLSRQARCELRLLDARYIITLPARQGREQGVTWVFLKRGLTWDDTLVRRYSDRPEGDSAQDSGLAPLGLGTYPGASPVIVSSRVLRRPTADFTQVPIQNFYVASDWRGLVGEMELDPETGTARRLFTIGLDDSLPGIEAPSCRVSAIRQDHEQVDFALEVSRDCYARLAWSYYPELQVTDNGAAASTWETADQFLLVRLNAGRHAIVIRPTNTPLRRSFGLLSAISLVIAVGLLAGTRIRRRARRHDRLDTSIPTT